VTSGPAAIADAIEDMGALSELNLASNNLGALVLPEGWTKKRERFDGMWQVFIHADGTKQIEDPGKPEGIIALANAIPDMRALTKLDISNNNIGQGEPLQLISEVCNTKGIELDNHDDDDDY
jgi:hypothetical protein